MKIKKKKDEGIIKKETIGGIIIISLLLLVLITYMMFYMNNKNKHKTNTDKFIDKSSNLIYVMNDNSFIKVDKTNNEIDTKKVIGKYNCKLDDCDIYENTIFNPIYDNKFIVLKENNKVFIYDYRLNIITSEYYDEIIDKKDNYFIVKSNNHTCLIDIEGNNLIPCDYDEIIINSKYNNLVKVKLNDKYGIYDIKNNLLLIDTIYEELDITDINYYKVYKDNLWYVIDKNNNIITNGYSYIYPFNKGFIALIDNKLEILKYSLNEELLNDAIIEVQDNNYKISLNNSILTIETDKVYEYEVNRNILKVK